MTTPAYGYATTLAGVPFADAVTKVTDALKAEGFGILAEIDVQGTLKKKLDVDVRPYTILGACNPKLAHAALQAEPHIGLLLPCNVLVQGAENGTTVSIMDPKAMMSVTGNSALNDVGADADARLRRVIAALAS
jgi:uncharacterized protein (DUF302 family)